MPHRIPGALMKKKMKAPERKRKEKVIRVTSCRFTLPTFFLGFHATTIELKGGVWIGKVNPKVKNMIRNERTLMCLVSPSMS